MNNYSEYKGTDYNLYDGINIQDSISKLDKFSLKYIPLFNENSTVEILSASLESGESFKDTDPSVSMSSNTSFYFTINLNRRAYRDIINLSVKISNLNISSSKISNIVKSYLYSVQLYYRNLFIPNIYNIKDLKGEIDEYDENYIITNIKIDSTDKFHHICIVFPTTSGVIYNNQY